MKTRQDADGLRTLGRTLSGVVLRSSAACALIVALFGATLAACASSPDDESSSAPLSERPSNPRSDEVDAAALEELGGRLAITDGADLKLTDPDGRNQQLIDTAAFLSQPTWAPNGSGLAWTRTDADGVASLEIRAVDNAPPGTGDESDSDLPADDLPLEGEPADNEPADDLPADDQSADDTNAAGTRGGVGLGDRPAIYLQWNRDSDRLVVLQNTDDLSGLELTVASADLTTGEVGIPELVGEGSPLYSSWGDNNVLAVHRGEELWVLNEGEQLPEPFTLDLDGFDPDDFDPDEPFDPDEDEAMPSIGESNAFETKGWFGTPYWVGESELMAAHPDELVTFTNPGVSLAPTELVPVAGPVRFVANDEGSLVAYLDEAEDGFLTIADRPQRGTLRQQRTNPLVLHVLDVESGKVSVVGVQENREITPFAWEWSPDGQTLAFLARSDFDPDEVRWYFWQRGAIVTATSAFKPSAVMSNVYLPFFDQYAQSHTGWAPDGTAYAFAGDVDGVSGVHVHIPGITPRSVRVSSGDMVTWSPGNVIAGGGVSLL